MKQGKAPETKPPTASSVWTISAVVDPKGGVDRRGFARGSGYTVEREAHGMVVSYGRHSTYIPWGNVACIVRDVDG